MSVSGRGLGVPMQFSYSLTEPTASDPLLSAASWTEALMLGTIATVLAVLAVGVVGLLMLNGQLNWRRGATVVLGCFLLFGAPTIASGLQSLSEPTYPAPDIVVAMPARVIAPDPAPSYDPYAGAAPARQGQSSIFR